jgi:hypothetical protein
MQNIQWIARAWKTLLSFEVGKLAWNYYVSKGKSREGYEIGEYDNVSHVPPFHV